jgi:hypothetical protein
MIFEKFGSFILGVNGHATLVDKMDIYELIVS